MLRALQEKGGAYAFMATRVVAHVVEISRTGLDQADQETSCNDILHCEHGTFVYQVNRNKLNAILYLHCCVDWHLIAARTVVKILKS